MDVGILILIPILLIGIMVFLYVVPLGLWVSALAAGVNVGIFTLVGMRLRRVNPSQIVMPLIKANKAGLDVNVNQLEAHYLAGGDVDRVVDALIAAERASIPHRCQMAALSQGAPDFVERVFTTCAACRGTFACVRLPVRGRYFFFDVSQGRDRLSGIPSG